MSELCVVCWKDLPSTSPDSTSSLTSFGLLPSTWHPTLKAVPNISFTVPLKSFARLLSASLIVRAILIISSSGMLLVCLIFFSFLRSRGGSFRALMTNEEADGTTETVAWRFWILNLTVTRRPFYTIDQEGFLALYDINYPIAGSFRNIFTDLLWR